MKNTIHVLEGTNLEYFTDDDKLLGSLINQFFFKDEASHFINSSWNVIELSNDYFIESLNFSLIKRLMELSNDDYLYLASATSPKMAYYKLSIKQDINILREFIDKNMLFTDIWYFMSPSEKWACISVYDYDTLFVGYNSEFEPKLKEINFNHTNFVKYLRKQ